MDYRKPQNNASKKPRIANNSEMKRPLPQQFRTSMFANEHDHYQAIRTGEHFGRYIVHGELGRGGMGIVYKAFDQKFQRFVALKVMIEKDRNEIRRFMRESAIMTQLDHPNIVRLYDFGDTPQPYLTMEYIEGFTLEDLIKTKKVPPAFLLEMLIKVCEALSQAHRQKVLHRDIKPSNIMITNQGEPKVMDFGLAKVATDKHQSISMVGGIVGTVLYMSKEQINGHPTHQSDIYSLGATMYEALTYQTVYQGDSFHEICFQVMHNDPIPPRHINPSISPYFEAICLKCIEKKPQRRYQNFKQLVRELHNFKNNKPIMAKKYNSWNFFVSLTRRYKAAFISLFIIMSVLCCSLVLVINYSIDADRARIKAEEQKNQTRNSLNKVMKVLYYSIREYKALQADKKFAQLFSEIFEDVESYGEDQDWDFLKAYMSSQSGDLQQSIQYYNKLLQENPNNSEVYHYRGLMHFNMKQYKKALQDLDRVIQITPKNLDAYNNRGLIYENLKDYTQAIANFDKILQINPNYAIAYENRASVYSKLRKYNKALQDIKKALQLNPNLATAYDKRGLIHHNLRNYSAALRAYSKALLIQPNFADAYHHRGHTYYDLQQFDKALMDYSKVIELNPKFLDIYYNRGAVYYRLRRYQEAIDDYNKVLSMDAHFADAYANRGLVYYDLQEYRKALADYENALQLDPQNPFVYANRGLLYNAINQPQKALTDLNMAIQLNPKLVNVYNTRGIVYRILHQYEKSLSDFNRAIQMQPTLVDAYRNRALLYQEMKDKRKELADWNKVIQLKPDFHKAYINRGNLYNSMQKYQQALRDYSQAIKLGPNDVKGYVNRGLVYCILKQYKNAIRDFDKSIAVSPTWRSHYGLHQCYKVLNDEEKAQYHLQKMQELKK
ncbi:serine/threonine-protein kinase [Candidatus Uabimicrobium amorphum]|uniref:Protein kinase domain-containing protein n=1 Tax=Uabimicrobium amorphum TaxID=2596890 RepID=A0A5S9ISD0_UABAM|nr:serine/threonine-protein kinase [Candidatus Uabimicrobium amorphum]BBM85795.1 hypothetical protein UABAM_04173 [Candidatus Uabimicrobium amorphum]